MKRLLLLVCLLAGIATAQPATMASRPCRMDGADCSGISGMGVSGRLSLWSSASALTSDPGLSVTGTGATLGVRVGTYTDANNFDVYIIGYDPLYWSNIGLWRGKKTAGTAQQVSLDIGTLAASEINLYTAGSRRFTVHGQMPWLMTGSGGVFGWSATNTGAALDTGVSRIAPGVVGVGTGAAGSTAGGLALTSVQWVTGTRPTCDAAARGTSWYVAGGTGAADTIEICLKSAADTYAWTALAIP